MIRKRTNHRNQKLPSIWQKCTNLRSLKQIHASMVVNGFTSNTRFLSELVYATAMCIFGPTTQYAHQLFDRIPQPDTFLWNTMIRGSAQSPDPLQALSLYAQMGPRSVSPDAYTFPFVLKACTKLFSIRTGSAVHGRVLRFGFGSNVFVRNSLLFFHATCGDLKVAAAELFDDEAKRDVVAWSSLVAAYARHGDLEAARKLFDEMPVRDLVSWNVMITGYVKRGDMKRARRLFDEAPRKDVVTWNAMIAGYVLSSAGKQSLELFEEMERIGECPDEVTMLSLLSACTDLGDLENGQKIHGKIMEMSSGEISTLLGNALVDMYAKCGSIKKALQVFWSIKDKDVSSWNSVITGLAFHGHAEESIDLFRKMQGTKVCPDEVTFTGVLAACSHAGKIDEGNRYFDLMRSKYKIEPSIKHFGCMVDMLGRAGLLEEAFDLIASMSTKIQPNAIIWRTLLGACHVHGDVEMAKLANKALLRMRRDHSGDYVLLSNLYASLGEWDGAERVRMLMDDSGVKKSPGSSFVEADNKALMNYLFESKPKVKSISQT